MMVSIRSAARASPKAGSGRGSVRMGQAFPRVIDRREVVVGTIRDKWAGRRGDLTVRRSERHVLVERLAAARFAVAAETDLLDAGLGLAEQALAMLLQRLAALVDGNRFGERDFAALESCN